MPVPVRLPRAATALVAAGACALSSLLLTAGPATAGTRAHQPAVRVSHDHPKVPSAARVLPRRLGGRAAITALGSHLAGVAARNDVSTKRLTAILQQDPTSRLSREGDLYYVEKDVPAATTTASATTATGVTPAYPAADTFLLHSHPGSTRKVYLNFVGGTVANTRWNGTGAGDIPNGTWAGLDLDGSPSTFSTGEDGYIQEVWRQVAETYAPFDVDVTTQDPGLDGLTRSSTSDQTYGTEVFVTSSSEPRTASCGSCLGYAWIGTFDAVDPGGSFQPAWVFQYSDFDPQIIAQAASHETGHTLGLEHDGTTTSDYYAGTAGWGPVMGSARLRAITQFSKGEYAGANNTEDDLAVIQSTGLPLRADDHPDTAATAEDLGAYSSYAVPGVIGTRADTDAFALTLPCTTDLTVGARGIGAQTALDLRLRVVDANGQTVATSSPTSSYAGSPPVSTGMNAQATLPGASGTYYVLVDGVGNGDPATGGWSDYGSLGQYTLTATGCDTAPPPATTPTDPTTPPTTPVTGHRPSRPRIGWASPGHRGGRHTAVARWTAPADDGGARITRYRVVAFRVGPYGRVSRIYRSAYLTPGVRARTMRLPRGLYRFEVRAWNQYGYSALSAASRAVRSR